LPAEPQPLNARTLKHWACRVPVPAYDRALVTPGVVHVGVGGFHRAHQAMYHDQLMNQGAALDWGICGVGMLPGDVRMRQVLDAQDGLYTLVLKHNDGTWEPRVIGSIVQYLYAPDDPEAVIETMAAPATKIISLTITEGGYNISDTTEEFDKDNPDVTSDLAPGAVPRTVFGLVTEALRRRRMRGLAPFAVMSCDNLPGNGQLSKTVLPPSPGCGTRAWPTGSSARRGFPTPWSTASPRHHRRRPGRDPGPVRDRRPVAGGLRAVHPAGAPGHLRGRPATVRAGPSAGRRRRAAV
jgi:hypothetical protein